MKIAVASTIFSFVAVLLSITCKGCIFPYVSMTCISNCMAIHLFNFSQFREYVHCTLSLPTSILHTELKSPLLILSFRVVRSRNLVLLFLEKAYYKPLYTSSFILGFTSVDFMLVLYMLASVKYMNHKMSWNFIL